MSEKAHEGGPEIDLKDVIPPRTSRHITGKTPVSVSIVAMGPSQRIWHNGNGSYNRGIPKTDEVWALNKGLRTLKADVGFVLDDLVGEARKSEEYAQDLRGLTLPIITSIIDQPVRELFPHARLYPFPIEEIIWDIGTRFGVNHDTPPDTLAASGEMIVRIGEQIGGYLQNSVPMMLAYAWYIGVQKVFVYGADYTYPGQEAREDDRACAEYWVGFCRGQNMEVQVCSDSTLLDTRSPKKIYGYGARQPLIRIPGPDDVRGVLRDLGVIE